MKSMHRVLAFVPICLLAAVAAARGQDALNTPEALYRQATEKSEWMDWETAIPLLDRALDLRPDYAEALALRGAAHLNVKQFDKAIADLEKAIALNPANASSYFHRGNAHHNLGDLAKAMEDYNKAIALNPEEADWHAQRGEAQLALGQNPQAISDLTEAIQLKPDRAGYYRSRAFAYAADGQDAKAAEDFAKVVELEPLESQDWHNLGVIKLRLGGHEEAIKALTQALELNPHRDNSYYSRANAYLETGDIDSALGDLSRVVELNPKKADAWGKRGLILLEKGRDAAARSDLARCFQLAPASEAQYQKAIEQVLQTRKVTPETAKTDAPLTPEDAVEQYEEAAKAGDVDRVGQIYYEPMSTPFRALFEDLVEVGKAKRRLVAALDARFGRGGLNAAIPDDGQVREQMKRLINMSVRSKTQVSDGYRLDVEITEMRRDGPGTTVQREPFLAKQQEGGWRVGPERSDEQIRVIEKTAAAMKKIVPAIDQLITEVEAGKFVSRYDAERELVIRAGEIMGQLKP